MLVDHQPGATSRARHWTRDRSVEAGLADDDADVIELLTAELIANAMQHGPAGGEVHVETQSLPTRFGVFVFDDTALIPVLRDPSPDACGGRGILVVDALATGWGYARMGPSSKAVWFFLDVPHVLSPPAPPHRSRRLASRDAPGVARSSADAAGLP